MKRFFSMVLALALVLTTIVIPASATEETVDVDITSISDGQTFYAGSNVAIAVKATEENVKNIDVYANGTKLPGTIEGNEGVVIWYNVVEGAFDVTTKVTDTDGNEKDGSKTVKIAVLPADDSKVTVLWPDGKNISAWETGSTQEIEHVGDYAMYGAQALKVVPHAGKTVTVTFTRDPYIERADKWNRMAAIVYAPKAIDGLTVSGAMKMADNTSSRVITGDLNVYQGYNRYVTKAQYSSETDLITHLAQFDISFSGAPEGNTEAVYVVGIQGLDYDFYNDNAGVVPVATAELGPDATVSKDLDTYRINFDSPIFPDATKVPAVVEANGTEVQDVEYTYGPNFVDLQLPELTENTEYTVSIPASRILSYYSAKTKSTSADANTYVAATEFKFTTSAEAMPIVKMTYPTPGESCLTNTNFAAKVVKGGAAIRDVTLYNGEEVVAVGKAMTNGEYLFTPATDALTVDTTTTLTVKAVDESGNTVTDSAAYTGAAVPSYAVKGIYPNATIVAQEEQGENARKITVVDSANANYATDVATNVEKVEFRHNGELVATDNEAPYEYELGFKKYFDNTLDVTVYDSYGGTHPFPYNYNVVNGVKNTTESVEQVTFENVTDGTDLASLIATDNSDLAFTTMADPDDSSNTVLRVGADGESNGYLRFKGAPSTTGAKVHYYKFDFVTNGNFAKRIFWNSTAYDAQDGQRILHNRYIKGDGSVQDKSATNYKAELEVVLDYNNGATATVYMGGKEFTRISLDATEEDPMLNLYIQGNKSQYVYIDNFEYSVYDVAPEKFGLGEYVTTISTGGQTGKYKFKSGATNTTASDVTVRYVIAAYDGFGRLTHVYGNDRLEANYNTDLNVTYEAGVVNQEVTFRFNMGESFETLRIFAFYSLNDPDAGALVPVGLFAE